MGALEVADSHSAHLIQEEMTVEAVVELGQVDQASETWVCLKIVFV